MSTFRCLLTSASRIVSALICGTIVCLLVACGTVGVAIGSGNSSPTPTTTATPRPSPTPSPTPSPSPTPAPLLTSCPATGTARAAVLEPIKPGTHATAIYTSDTVLERYDAVTAQKSQLLDDKPFAIQIAQVSADGQWVLFLSTDPQQKKPSMLQLVRVDGQKLQTLYCAPASAFIDATQWSYDQKSILLETYDGATNSNIITWLDTTTGKLQTELQTAKGQQGFNLVQWLDNTRAYVLKGYGLEPGPRSLYLLDVSKAHKLDGSDLPKVQDFPAATGSTYDDINASKINTDGQHLYISQNHTITVEGATGSPQQIIYKDATRSIVAVRVTAANALLFVTFTQNGGFGAYDLWKVNVDGSSPVHIASNSGAHTYYGFNGPAPYSWSNASRDGRIVTIMEVGNMSGYNALLLGSVNGGKITTVASGGPGTSITRLTMVGWTTM